jgi:competence protein ComEA
MFLLNLAMIKSFILSYRLYFIVGFVLFVGACTLLITNQRGKIPPPQVEDIEVLEKESVKKIYVDIEGAVTSPGLYNVPQDTRVGDLLKLAGGLLDSFDPFYFYKEVNLAFVLKDGDKVYVPFEWEYYESSATATLALEDFIVTNGGSLGQSYTERSSSTSSTQEAKPLNSKVNVNTATKDIIDGLSGIGEVYTVKIINSRPYKDFTDLVSKSGVPEATLVKIQADIEF